MIYANQFGNAKGKLTDSGLQIQKRTPKDKIVALAGNPNVGKSTIFNALTGLHQHTGNWPGKTVQNAKGYCVSKRQSYMMVDLPGTYSLMAHSTEEEVARNFICFGKPDVVVVICDATCLERSLNLVLQTMEIHKNVIVCVNLMDEAEKKQIHLDLTSISTYLGVPVIGTTARKKKSLTKLLDAIDRVCEQEKGYLHIKYPKVIEEAASLIELCIQEKYGKQINSRWLSLKLLDPDASLVQQIHTYLGEGFLTDQLLQGAILQGKDLLATNGVNEDQCKDLIVSTLVNYGEYLCKTSITYEKHQYDKTDRILDQFLTNKYTGYGVMVCLLAFVFWLTITGANIPSRLLSRGLFWIQDRLTDFFSWIHAPNWLHGMLILGAYRVLAWVVSVMLPPMAIFFPLFTLLEDVGYLPRIAYNLDKPFKKCCACGKQALCMCMGFGCNAAGIIGCRIIDSPRERLLAILTNNFVPCNGRFPTLIAILTMFFVGTSGGALAALWSALLLTLMIMLGIAVTLVVTKTLSMTVLKGMPSFFLLEMPPYRKPQIGKVILHSVFDRTLFVLGRAMIVAAPVGILIWLLANVTVGNYSLLHHCVVFLDPFARWMGLDGIILMAFILGFPANEIVIPIIIMTYMAQGSLLELESLTQMRTLFEENGWTWITAMSTMLFSLMHWPCSTTLITIKKETGSWKWTALAAGIPTVVGVMVCIVFNAVARRFL